MIQDPVLVVVAAGFVAMGLAACAQPARVPALFGVHELTAEFRNEVRAVYGGFGIAIGVLLLAVADNAALAPGVRLAVAVSLLGMVAGRVLAWCVERSGPWPRVFAAIELLAGAALLLSA